MGTINSSKLAIVYHPGITLKEKLEEMGMSIKEFALRTNKPEKTIIAVIKGESAITPEMAVSFENVTKIPAHFWTNKQMLYDEYQIRLKREEDARNSSEWASHFPINEMVKRHWIPTTDSIEAKVNALYAFFGISSKKSWEDYYINKELKLSFRISLAHTRDPYAISAWLRAGEINASETSTTNSYSAKALTNALPEMKQTMANGENDFFEILQNQCSEVGIKLINIQCLPKAPINGATRWINDTPIIQLTNRYKRYDILWFTFFHEIGHILKHGKKAIFLEESAIAKLDKAKEDEADEFAAEILLSKKEEEEIIDNGDFSCKAIKSAAKRYSTHPSVIIGRLQHLGLIKYWQDQSLMKNVEI
jgi:addiction module HigA family antidote